MVKNISLQGLSREDLLVIADRACCILAAFANNVTTDEGDRNQTEDDFGISAEEMIEMAHDDMIVRSRSVLSRIVKDFPGVAKNEKAT